MSQDEIEQAVVSVKGPGRHPGQFQWIRELWDKVMERSDKK